MSETIKETIKEVVSNVKDLSGIVTEPAKKRMGHPFIGSFAISWILFNWKPIAYFIMTSSKVEDRIIYIDDNFYHWNHLFAYPLLVAVFYTLILSWFDAFSDVFNKVPYEMKNKHTADVSIDKLNNEIRIVGKQVELENAKADNKPLKELNNRILLLSKELEIKEKAIITIQQEQLNRLKQLEELEKHNNVLNSKLVNFSATIEKLKNDHKLDKLNLLSIMKSTTSHNKFYETVKYLKEINPELLSDKDFKELIEDNKLKNKFSSEYILSLSSSKGLEELISSLESIDDRILVEKLETKDAKGRSQSKLLVQYPEANMREHLDFIIANT